MDMETARLLTEIKNFLRTTGMKATYFGQRAARNQHLVKRLESGGTVTLTTAERVRTYMSDPSVLAHKKWSRNGKKR